MSGLFFLRLHKVLEPLFSPDSLADIQRRIWRFMERIVERLQDFVLTSQLLRSVAAAAAFRKQPYRF